MGGFRRLSWVAELLFFTGTVDCGTSTLALQMRHNHAAQAQVLSFDVLPVNLDMCPLPAL